jgi:hypothetical protein
MKNGGGHFAPELGGHFELESGGQYHWNLHYGEWENQTSNIKPFFTATYAESEKEIVVKEDLKTVIQFAFVGSLVSGKNPMYAIQLIEKLKNKGRNVVLNVYGNGIESSVLKNYS